MDRQTQKDFSKATLDYLKSEFDNLPNITDEAIAPVSRQFVDAGRGSRWFSQKAALRYQWDNNQHREIIYGYINETMKTQRSYATDTLHHRVRRQQPADTPLNCPGCLLHPAGKTSTNSAIRYDDSDDPIDYGYSSDGK